MRRPPSRRYRREPRQDPYYQARYPKQRQQRQQLQRRQQKSQRR